MPTLRLFPLLRIILLASAISWIAAAACAQSYPNTPTSTPNTGYGSAGKKDVCTDDYAKFCGGVDKFAMRQCLLDHQQEYSSACKAKRAAEAEAKRRSEYLPVPVYH